MLKDRQAVAFLTVKEGQESGHRIYSVELETIETLEGHINRIEDLLRGSPSSVAEGSVARVRGMFKTYFEDAADGGREAYVQTKREWREAAGKENMKMNRVLKPCSIESKRVMDAYIALQKLSAAIYLADVDSEAFERAKDLASSAVQRLNLESLKDILSADDMMVVKSSSSLLNAAKPLSVDSAAIPSSSEIKNDISNANVSEVGEIVNKKNARLAESAAEVADDRSGVDADGELRTHGMQDAARERYVQTKREWREEAGKENMKMSRDEALNVILLCEQAGYADAAADHGFTPEVLDGLRKYVGEEAMRYGDFLRAGLDGNGLAAVYEAREGVPFPKVENYWPGRFDQSSRVNENANALEVAAGMGTAYGMLITRVKHNLRFDLSIGATNSFRAAMAQQNNYIVMGELTSRWRKMLTHADFALAMKNHMGDTQFKTFKGLLNLIDGQGTQIAATETLASNLVSMMQSAHAMAVLSGAVPTLIKQVSAILNGTVYGGVGMWELLREVGRPGAASIKDIAGLDCIKARFAGEEEYERMQKMGRNVGWSQAAVLAPQ